MQSWMIGLASGIVCAGFWPVLPPWPLLLVLATIAVAVRYWQTPAAAFIGGLACGCALGFVHGTLLLQSRITQECVGVPLSISGTVSSLPRVSRMPGGGRLQRFEFSLVALSPSPCAGPKTLLLSYYGERTIRPGDEWRFEVKLKKPWGLANPGGYNMQAWFAQQGIDAVGSVRETGPRAHLVAQGDVLSLPNRLRLRISTRIAERRLAPQVAAILRAITVADSSGIDPPLWFLFQQLGINHLLVISGLHVGMVAAVGYLLGGLLLRLFSFVGIRAIWLPAVFALLLACLYGALAGFSLPVQRALCMLSCFVIASLAGRKSAAVNSLLLAAVCVLILNPLAAVGSGFWLSFGAVAALLWFARWQRGLGTFQRVLQTQGAMSLVMLPLGALFFGGGSLVAVLVNLLMIPLVGWVVVPLALLAVACFWCGWELESILWDLAAWPLAKLLPLASAWVEMYGRWLYVQLDGDIARILLGVIAVALLTTPGRSGLKLLALLMAMPLLLPLDRDFQTPSLDTEVTVLDVGQGTAVVVSSGDRTLLYDTGGGDPHGINMGSLAVLPYLRQRGVSALDTLIISHPDLDHSAGSAVVRDALSVGRFRYGGAAPDANKSGGEGRPCIAGESWRWPGGQLFQFMSPAQETPRRRNDSSCVLQVEIGGYRLLLPGDVEAERERILVQYWGEQLASDWLLAAHHGSKTSTTSTLLKRVQPQAVVISSGYANRFGHPHWRVMERLRLRGVDVYSTSTAGALEFSVVFGQPLQINAYRLVVRRYWM